MDPGTDIDALRRHSPSCSTGSVRTCRSRRPSPTSRTRRSTSAPNVDYTAWHLIEHLRLTQADILDYS